MTAQHVEIVLVIANQPRADHLVFPAEELKKQADGHRHFWDEQRQALLWRGPAAELKASAPAIASFSMGFSCVVDSEGGEHD